MSGAVDHAGWAFKQGSKVKNWKKRYFVLRGRELSYFGSQNIYGRGEDEKGRVTVVGIESVLADAKSREELLLITCERKSHLLKIKPLNAEDARVWMAKIQIAVAPNQLNDEYRTDTTVNATNLFGTDIHDEQDDCDGDGIVFPPPSAPTESVQAYYKVAPSTSAFAQPTITNNINNTNNANNANNANANNNKTNALSPSHRLLAESSLAMDTEDNQYDSDQDATNNLLQQHGSSRTLARGSLAKGNHIGVTREGWVTVGDPQDQRSWKKRYGVLAGPSFTYFASKGSDQALDTVWIEGVALSRVRPNALDVKLDSGRVLGLAVDSREELIEWERGIAAVLGTSVLLRSVSSRDDALLDGGSGHDLQSDPVGGRPSSYTGVFREGWLLLKHGFGKTEWKRRYFVLNGATLQERESATSRHNVSESFVVHMDVQNDSEMEVELMSGRTLWLRAENAADTEAWIHALSDLVGTPSAPGAGLATLSPVSTPVIRPLIQNVAPFQPTRGYEEDLNDEDDDDDSTGYGTWDDAMRNRPSLDRESSWESDTSETIPPKDDPAAIGYDSDGSKETPALTQERRGHAGWLKKEGGNIKNWKRRYFTLHGTTLKYFKSASSSSPLRSLEVTQVEELPSTKFGFAVTTAKGRRLVVTAESQDQYEKWLVVLWGVLADQRASLTAMSSSSSPTAAGRVSGSAGSTASVSGVKSGWLEKEGQVFKTWKKRYFTLANGALVYYTDIGGDPQGHGAVHGVIVDKTKANTLRILMGKDRVMRVTAASAAEMTAWFQALSTSLSKASDDGGLSEASSNSSPSSAARSMGGSSPLNQQQQQQQQQTRGQQQETRASRFDADDYLKNDTITNESFVRIRGAGDELSLTNGSFYKPRSFKGELTLSAPNESSSSSSTEPVTLVRIESDDDDDLEYLRGSNVDNKQKMEALRRKKQQEEDDGHVLLLPTQCAPCCAIQ